MILKRAAELDVMAEAAAINREALGAAARAVAPGVSTAELNRIAEDVILSRGGRPVNKGYPNSKKGYSDFPAALCTSVNEVVVHGIPNARPLRSGDIVTIDVGTTYKGYVADMARTYAVGEISPPPQKLLTVTEEALAAGIDAARAGNRLGDVSAAIQSVVEGAGFWIIREFVGHGIGRDYHEAPEVPNYGRAGKGPVLRPGLVLAIEPMVAEKRTKVVILDDGWTAPTANRSLAAHFEHTVAITKDGPRVLTAGDSAGLTAGDKPPQRVLAEKGVYGA